MGLLNNPNIKELKRRNDVEGLIKALGDEDSDVRQHAPIWSEVERVTAPFLIGVLCGKN